MPTSEPQASHSGKTSKKNSEERESEWSMSSASRAEGSVSPVEVEDIPLRPHAQNSDGTNDYMSSLERTRKLYGYLNKVVTKGGKRNVKTRWVTFSAENCKLYVYKSPNETEAVEEIDISVATFSYDVEKEDCGQFFISFDGENHEFQAGSVQKRSYWLQELQQERRNFSIKRCYMISHPDIGGNLITGCTRPLSGLLKGKSPVIDKKEMPADSLLTPVERPKDLAIKPEVLRKPYNPLLSPNSPEAPRKERESHQDSQFKLSILLPGRSKSKSREENPSASPPTPPLPSPSSKLPSPRSIASRFQGNLSSFQRLHRSFREKKGGLKKNDPLSPLINKKSVAKEERDCRRCEQLVSQVESLQQDLQATEDEYHAAKEVISVLQKQVDVLTMDKEALLRNQVCSNSDPSLLHLLEARAVQLVELRHQNQVQALQLEQSESTMADLHDRIAMYQETLQAKNEAVVRLTGELHDLSLRSKEVHMLAHKPSSTCQSSQTDPGEEENLRDAVTAFRMQNRFLNKEILELNYLRQEANERENKLLMQSSEWEARFYQIQSKYLLLLNELHNPQAAQKAASNEVVSQLLEDVVGSNAFVAIAKGQAYDKYGFRQPTSGDSLQLAAARLQRQSEELSTTLQDDGEDPALPSASLDSKWEALVGWLESPREINSRLGEVKAALRGGVPYHLRGRVWRAVLEYRSRGRRGPQIKAGYYQKLLGSYRPGPHLTPAAKQIELDLVRTLPTNRHYESLHADGIPKLRRVLLAYSLHNPGVDYCQGFNRLVAIALLFMTEENAFWCLVFIVEHLMPPDYYNKQLIGAQVDQKVFKDVIAEKLPCLHAHLEEHSVDLSIFTLNWFLCLFVDGIPVDSYLRVWDTFLFEGSKVLFRYALAILKVFEKELLSSKDCMGIFNCLRTISESQVDMKRVSQVAFQELNPFPMRNIMTKREHHHKILKAQMEQLEIIRQDYYAKVASEKPSFLSDEED